MGCSKSLPVCGKECWKFRGCLNRGPFDLHFEKSLSSIPKDELVVHGLQEVTLQEVIRLRWTPGSREGHRDPMHRRLLGDLVWWVVKQMKATDCIVSIGCSSSRVDSRHRQVVKNSSRSFRSTCTIMKMRFLPKLEKTLLTYNLLYKNSFQFCCLIFQWKDYWKTSRQKTRNHCLREETCSLLAS